MSGEQGLAVALLVISGVLLARFGPVAVRSWQIYRGTGERRQRDATGRAPMVPPDVADRIAILATVGYERLGVTSLDLPIGERFAWILAASDADSYVIVVPDRGPAGLTGIYSAWLDGTWLGTMHPFGQPGDRSGLHTQVVTTTLTDAVAAHRTALGRLRGVHGAPRPVRRMPDMLALDADYRERFGGSRLRPLTVRNMTPAILSAAVFVIAAILLLISSR